MIHFCGKFELDCFLFFIFCTLFGFFLLFDMVMTLVFFFLHMSDEFISFNCLSSYFFFISSYFIDELFEFIFFCTYILYVSFLIYTYFIYFF